MGIFGVKVGNLTVDLLDDDRIVKGIQTKKEFEPHTLALWAEICEPGVQVLDVGAYSGLFSILAAKRGAEPKAIEPMPDLVERIQANSELNGVKFEIIQAAAAEKDGNARLGYNDTVHLTSGASLLRKSRGHIFVRTLRLDGIRGLNKLAAIKIDVERAEMMALKGAMKLIAREKPILIIEVLDNFARALVEQTLSKTHQTKGMYDNRNLVLEPR